MALLAAIALNAGQQFFIALFVSVAIVCVLIGLCVVGLGIMLNDLWNFLKPVWELFNSAFITAAFGALGGAYFGQRIVERGARRKELREEIQSTNAASSIAFHICNSLIGLKKQHIKGLKERFDKDKAHIVAMRAKHLAGQLPAGTEITFQADFRTLTSPAFATDVLQKLLFEKLSLLGRAPIIVSTLDQTLKGLTTLIAARNELIEHFKSRPYGLSGIPFFVYFGLPDTAGHIDQVYADFIDGMYHQTDSAIYFSNLLCKDLATHGDALQAEYKAKYRSAAPKVSRADFSKNEFMPDPKDFADWEKMFAKKEDDIKNDGERK